MLEDLEDSETLKRASKTADKEILWQDINDNDNDNDLECDSYGSMETLSDTISITIQGEKHWVSGIDATTTCTELICALLQYQNLEEKRTPNPNPSKLSKSSQIPITIQNQTKDEELPEEMLLKRPIRNSHEYVIVKQLRHCNFEEYLDGSTRLLDVVPLKDNLGKKLCELQLRNLSRRAPVSVRASSVVASPTSNQNRNHILNQNQLFSMLSMSTDKDSGMGSPVGSSRSERFRRRRGKQRAAAAAAATTTATPTFCRPSGDLLDNAALSKRSKQQQTQQQQQSKSCSVNPNERLMNIILAQDQTINRQMYLLHEKEQQILQIEDEKHRVRERELGKNYLLESYLNTLEKPSEAAPKNTEDYQDEGPRITPSKVDEEIVKADSRLENGGETVDSTAAAAVGHLPDDMQIYWLEKVYSLNKLLQREEEQLLRLHAKVRKQQVRYAYQTKGEVLQQIDRLDTDLAIQVTDIYRVERQLLMANEQLKAKLGVLECLGREFEVEVLPLNETTSPTNKDMQEACNILLDQPDEQRCHHPNYVSLLEKNCNVRTLTESKNLKKQMFNPAGNSTNPSLQTGTKTNQIPQFDIQHLGTLV